MNGSGQARHRRFLLLPAAVVFALIVVPAAGSGAAEGGSSAHDVADGLKKINSIAVDVAANTGKDKAKAADLAESIEGVWKPIEDTVRGNDKDAYIAFEDAFESLGAAAKAGDATKAGKAAHSVGTTVSGYLAKYPDLPAAAPAPAPGAKQAPVPDAAPAPSRSAAAATPAPAAAPAPAKADAAAPAKADAAAPAKADAAAPAKAAAPAGDATLARTGRMSGPLSALAGAAFILGGLAVIGGARRRTVPIA